MTTGASADVRDDIQARPPRRSRRLKRTTIVLTAGATTVVVAAAAAATVIRHHASAPQVTATPLPTVAVERTNLTETQQFNGALGYADSYQVAASGPARGTVTWLPQQGSVISRGHEIFGVNGRPVELFYGSVPLWRTLEPGVSDGPDVREVEHDLVALGFSSGITVDDHYTSATADAVKAWQDSLDLPQTGTISPGDVIIEPGQIRVSSVSAALGSTASRILTASGISRIVTVSVPVSQEQLAARGGKVTVQLPGGVTTTGHVAEVGTVAQAGSQGNTAGVSQSYQGDQQLQNATVQVRIALDHPASAGRFDEAPAVVSFTSQQVRNVLAVPVTALLAQPDGGYAVEVVTASSRRIMVPVQLGMFADDKVQVSGTGLSAGQRVEVPGQ